MLKSVSFNTLYQIIGKGISLVIGLAIASLLTRGLTQDQYGQYTLITSLIIQTAAISDWGTGFIAVRAAAQNKYPLKELFSNLLYLRLALTTVGILLFLIFSAFQTFNLPENLYYIALIALVATNLKNIFISIFQAKLKFSYLAFSESSINILFYLLLYFFIQQQPLTPLLSLTYLTYSVIFGTIIAFLFSVKFVTLGDKLNLNCIKYLLKESLPMGGQLFIFNVYNRIDVYFLQYFQGETAVAIYGLSYKLYENLILGAAYFMNSLFPILSQSSETSRHKVYQTAGQLIFLAGIIISILGVVSAPWLIRFINPDYQASILPLQILCFGLLFTYINHLTGYTLASLNQQASFFKISLIGLAINLIANLILIPRYSYYAAAWTTVLTEFTLAIGSLWLLSRQLNYHLNLYKTPQTLKTIINRLLKS